METDNFEKHIRTKLRDREINPSSQAWEHISRELGTVSSPKKPVYLWMGIAASIVILLGIAIFYFDTDTEVLNHPMEVVDTNKKEPLEVIKDKKALPFEADKAGLASKGNGQGPPAAKSGTAKGNAQNLEGKGSGMKDDTQVAELNYLETKTALNELKLSEQIIKDKVAELVMQVDDMEQYTTVTDAEVDSLLKMAQEEILKQKIFRSTTAVDASALLTVVEEELDQSFRDQIFNSLKDGFIKVRTAVADRNN